MYQKGEILSKKGDMNKESGKTHKDDYKKRQRVKPRDCWVKKNPPGPLGLNRKGRRELAKRIRRGG